MMGRKTCQQNHPSDLRLRNKSRFDATKMIVVCGCCGLENYLPYKKFYDELDCCHCKVKIWDEDKENKGKDLPTWLKK